MWELKVNSLLTILIMVLFMKTIKMCNCSGYSNNNNSSQLGCKPYERKALLKFKESVTFYYKHVSSSWKGEDCCSWLRVKCDPTTGHVVQLHLNGNDDWDYLFEARKIESSLMYLVELNHLQHLDLSINNFSSSKIPKFMGRMNQLRYLNLSSNSFHGRVPDELGNLTHLQALDLSNFNNNDDRLFVHNLKWASSLGQLRHLSLSWVNLSQAHDWIGSLIGPLPYLEFLVLSYCSLPKSHQLIKNSSSHHLLVSHPQYLSYLDLSDNSLEGDIPPFVQNMTSLEYLDLSYNKFESQIPLWLGKLNYLVHLDLRGNALIGIEGDNIWSLVHNLCNLRYLDMKDNRLEGNLLESRENISSTSCTHFDLELLDLSNNAFISGSIGAWLGEEFQSLKSLSLNDNNISGPISNSLGKLSFLEDLKIYNNSLESVVLSETHFANLSSLRYLDMSDTMLTIKFASDWVSPFQLKEMYASTCKFDSELPGWFKTQKNLTYLVLSNSEIQGALPSWFHNLQSLTYVDLSNNNITGCPVFPINFIDVDLSNNSISCLTNSSHKNNIVYQCADTIDLSRNVISGKLPQNLYHTVPYLNALVLSNNLINGLIPKSMCHHKILTIIDLQKNRLSGKIPSCLGNQSSLTFIGLSFNRLSGDIPFFNNSNLAFLHLSDNMLSGEFPSFLNSHPRLNVLDVGENNLSGIIDVVKVPELQILRLRKNKLRGRIPKQLCSLSKLQILDLGHNYLTGTIPYCLSNLTAMNLPPQSNLIDEKVKEVIQGYEREYTTNVGLLVSIDLSYNKLVGSIPKEITKLSCLLSLNLSYNHLSGQIPRDIGGLKSLMSLDLSRNKLSGSIPTSLAALNFLASLDLSHNNLSIRVKFQLETSCKPSTNPPTTREIHIFVEAHFPRNVRTHLIIIMDHHDHQEEVKTKKTKWTSVRQWGSTWW